MELLYFYFFIAISLIQGIVFLTVSSYTWAMNEACLRMQERGIDLSPVAETVGFKIK